jgi:hypothetical protein
MLGVRKRWAVDLVAVVVALIGVTSPASAAEAHRCPSHRYWRNIVVHGIT